jgi:hypothetical protein
METGIGEERYRILRKKERNIHTGGTIFIMTLLLWWLWEPLFKSDSNLMLIADGHPLMMQFLAK